MSVSIFGFAVVSIGF